MSEGMSERQEVMPPCWDRTPLALWREGGREGGGGMIGNGKAKRDELS